MWQQPKEYKQKIHKDGGRRIIIIPDDFFLEGEEIIIRQEKDGMITVHPGDAIGREAMDAKFGLFSDWED